MPLIIEDFELTFLFRNRNDQNENLIASFRHVLTDENMCDTSLSRICIFSENLVFGALKSAVVVLQILHHKWVQAF